MATPRHRTLPLMRPSQRYCAARLRLSQFYPLLLRLTLVLITLCGCKQKEAPSPQANENKSATAPLPIAPEVPSAVKSATPTAIGPTTAKTNEAAAKPTPKPSPIIATVQRLRAENVQRLQVSRGARFISLVSKGGLLQTIDGSRGRIVAEHLLAPARLCRGRAITRNGRRVLVRSGKQVQLKGLFDGLLHYEGLPHEKRPACTLDGDGFHVVELSTAGGQVTNLRNKSTRKIIAPGASRIRSVHTDRTARVIVADAVQGKHEVWLVYGGKGGKFWRALPRERGGSSMALSTSGRWLITSFGETRLQLWDLHSDKQLAQWPFRRVFQFQGGDDRVLVQSAENKIELIDRESGESVSSLALEFAVSSAAMDASGQRFLAVGLGGRPEQQVLGSWDVDSSAALFVKRFPVQIVRGLAWDTQTLRITNEREDRLIDIHTGRTPSRPPNAIPKVDGTTLPREGRSKKGDVRVRMGGKDAAALSPAGTIIVSHRTETSLRSAAWRTTAAASPSALVTVDSDGLVTLKDRQSTVVYQLPDPIIALTADAKGGIYGISRSGTVLELDSLGAPTSRARLPRRVSRADIDVTDDGKIAIVVSGSQGYRIQLDQAGRVSEPFTVPPIAKHVAISADGAHVAVSDGVDVFTYNKENQGVAIIRLQPSRRTVVTSFDGTKLLPKEARSSVRLRQGERLLSRGDTIEKQAWDRMTTEDIPL